MRPFALAVGVLGGLTLSLVVQLPLLVAVALAGIAAISAFVARRGSLLLLCLLVVGLLAGMARGALPDVNAGAIPAGQLVGQEVVLNGTVRDTPSPRGQLTRIRVTLESAQNGRGDVADPVTVEGDAIAWVYPPSIEFGVGDRVQLAGVPEFPAPDDDDESDGREIREVGASWPDDLVILLRPRIQLVEKASPPMVILNSLRRSLSESLERNLSSPHAELAQALLLGQRDSLPAELNEDWRRAGTAHLLAISGLHVSVVLGVTLIGSVMALGRRRGLYVLAPLALVWVYAVLSGLNPPVVRAAVMGTAYLGAVASGRQPSGGLALVATAGAMAMWNPSVITTASFQMTVAAMAGIVFLTDPLRRFMRFGGTGASSEIDVSFGGGFRQASLTGVAASLGAVIGIKPLLLHYFGATSLFTIPASLVGTVALPAVLLSSFIAAVLGAIADGPIAAVAGWVAWPFLSFLIGLSSLFAAPAIASMTIAPLPAEVVVLIYLLGISVFLLPILKTPSGLLGPIVSLPSMSLPSGRKLLTSAPILGGLAVVTVAAGIGAAAPSFADDRQLKVHVLDIGQGDAILIKSPTGHRILIDGGPDGALLQRRLSEHLPWWSRRIDVVILTHPSADHIIGLTEAVKRFDVGYVIDPQMESITRYGQLWEAALREQPDHSLVRAERGVAFDIGGGAHLEILHPPARRPFDTAAEHDDNSVVTKLTYGEVSFLFAADIYQPGEEFLLESGVDVQATVLKVGHQGSRYSSTPDFLKAVSPRVAVISAGEGNRFGHPHAETLQRLESLHSAPAILRTDLHGTVTLTTDGVALEWETKRAE